MKKIILIFSSLVLSLGLQAQEVTTFAGSGAIGSTDGLETAASFYSPRGVAVDIADNVYVADVENNKVRK